MQWKKTWTAFSFPYDQFLCKKEIIICLLLYFYEYYMVAHPVV